MTNLKKFNASENRNWDSSATYEEGTLTWDPDNGLRLHDGNTSGGNQVGGFSGNYWDLYNKPSGNTAVHDLIGGSSSIDTGKFLKQDSMGTSTWAYPSFLDYNNDRLTVLSGGAVELSKGSTIENQQFIDHVVGGADIQLSDLAYASPGGPGATINIDGFTNDGWQYISFDNEALYNTVTAFTGTSTGYWPITWADGSTQRTGYVIIQFNGGFQFQICPILDAGAGNNTPVSGTWKFPANLRGSVVNSANVTLTVRGDFSNKEWVFNNDDGSTTFPNGTSIVKSINNGNASDFKAVEGAWVGLSNHDGANVVEVSDDQIALMTNTSHVWWFKNDGDFKFPDGSLQSTAWTGDQDVSTTSAVKFDTVQSNIIGKATIGANRYTITNITAESPWTNPIVYIAESTNTVVAGEQIEISGVTTPAEANGTWYLQNRDAVSFRIFSDSGLTTTANASGWASYTGSGIVKNPDTFSNLSLTVNNNVWDFNTDGTITIPAGSDILDRGTGLSVLGGAGGGTGYTGSAGNDGMPGEVGYTGSQGDQGLPGNDGMPGEVGYTGSQGDVGFTGSAGTNGTSVQIVDNVSDGQALASYNTSGLSVGQGIIQEDTGHLQVWNGSSFSDVGQIKGDQGNLGYTGSQGEVGFTGSAGNDGMPGDTGYTGSAGVSLPMDNPGALTNDGNGTLSWSSPWQAEGYITSETQPDWNEVNMASPAYINNKPDFSIYLTSETQSDWNEVNMASPAYIQNRPDLSMYVSGTPWQNEGYLTGTPWTLEGYITYNDIPTNLSAFTNDSGFITSASVPTNISSLYNDSGFITSADIPPIPSDISNLTDNSNLLSSVTGYTGSQGDVGFTGSQGEQGMPGNDGAPGMPGNDGAPGMPGNDGMPGDTGYTGSQGDVGYTGSIGDTGYTGSQGDVGYTGSQGDQGNIGYTGSIGIGYTGSSGASLSTIEMKNSSFTAVVNTTYWLDSSSGAKTMTLPASPSVGDWVKVYDGSLSWQTNNLTVNGNGNNIKSYNMSGGGWASPASTNTLNQPMISPVGPFPAGFMWDGTNWCGIM